ncbi:type I-C CRISPR-associated protein Cas5c [Veillonella sp. R32]|uniref:type I-C CRISPR-associated protein Cas5c n=1 Tax=Veillonella sp. R32 TaxID=2021312 RepID=UPI0013897CAD|nr:type I-C CRISPR-associated protein Cas5c [Veillonella sp. R32]KAF1679124.1 type I-C CRISPR-associated protein Cas5 [Veillonella sp. R32]
MFQSNPFYMKIYGDYALFTDPMSKGGGEKFTYQVPTYQAIKGIIEAVYWKPTFVIYVDQIKVLNPIKTESKGLLFPPLISSGSTQRVTHTYLKDVAYGVKFHFEWNEQFKQFSDDRNEIKHEQIMLRSMKKGGRRDIFLGVRECLGYISKLSEREYEELSTFQNGDISLGLMFHSFVYPRTFHESVEYEEDYLYSNFSPIIMSDGVITFCRPEECTISHQLRKFGTKKDIQIKPVVDELNDYGEANV